ncbi:hypothetical protein HanRHA438_Chr17g0823101 [Helianthus annuus]|nr:hypothetical protein HanRHA438_Chr17g0823101 [Helianthus annuus]
MFLQSHLPMKLITYHNTNLDLIILQLTIFLQRNLNCTTQKTKTQMSHVLILTHVI